MNGFPMPHGRKGGCSHRSSTSRTGLKLALEQVEGSAELAPIISPKKCFESGQVSEGAEMIVGRRRSGDRFCYKAEDDEADRISSRAAS